MGGMEQQIFDMANELGYEGCGIIPLDQLSGYGEKMQERMEKAPQSAGFYQRQGRLANPQEAFPWAQSVVVVAERYGKYAVPDEVKNRIGRHYLFDARVNEETEEYRAGSQLEGFMQSLGLQTANERKFGLVGLRWAAMKAGIGTIRRNNFFYTKSGSWVTLQGWLIDRRLELIGNTKLPQCSDRCNRCVEACPSGSLSAPYTMSPVECVSFLTTFGGRDLPNSPLRKSFGSCIYGCDICQDVCPMNKGKGEGKEDFPGLAELAPRLTPEGIMEMDDDFYRDKVQPKFFYLKPDELWKWKVNALTYMGNNYQESYRAYINAACGHDHEKIREMARLVNRELEGA